MKFRKTRHQDAYINSERNIVHRKEFARQMISILERNKVILNFDESVISGTTGRSYSWDFKGQSSGKTFKQEISGLSIMAAASSSGEIYFSFIYGNNNEGSFASFLIDLEVELTKVRPH